MIISNSLKTSYDYKLIMSLKINGKKFFRTNEALKRAGISRATFFRWLKGGIIQDVILKDRRGWRLFTYEDIENIKREALSIKTSPVQERMRFGA